MKAGDVKRDLDWLRRVSSFTVPRIILTANNFGIFDHLDGRAKTAGSVAKAISADARASELLLNSLTAIGLLKKEGTGYRNTEVASRYLVKGKPEYQGDILGHYNVLWENWSGLDRVLKTGKPFRKAHDHKSFILGMHNLAIQKASKIAEALHVKGGSILDLGGGPGTYSMEFAKRNNNVTLFDYPDTFRISKPLIRDAGLQKRITLKPGDITKDDWGGGYDLVFISQILHAYGPDECLAMLKKAFGALNPGGKAVVQEFYLEEGRTGPVFGAVFAINMLVNTPNGRTYTVKEMSSWMKKTGFKGITATPIYDSVLISGTRK